jgi:uncharacterized protein YaaW (UPF0174 family)
MNGLAKKTLIGRRPVLVLIAAGLGVFGWLRLTRESMAQAAPFVLPNTHWTADHFYNFLHAFPGDAMLSLKKAQGLLKPEATKDQLSGIDQDARDIQKQALWLSTNFFEYPFRDETKLNYHDLVNWVAQKAGIPEEGRRGASTFALERELLRVLFAQLWDKLNPQQRKELLEKLDPNGVIKDRAATAAMSGASVLAVLSATVAFTGFAFYTTMSVTIAAVASAAGVTLPFAVYAGASTVIGILSGPVGWAIMGLAALGGIALAGRPNAQKTALLIAQIHALKIEALVAAGVPEKDVFKA